VAFFSPLKHGLLLGKYQEPTAFEAGDMRRGVREFQNQEILDRLRHNKRLIEQQLEHPTPVLQALVGFLLTDCPTASVLLGQRDPDQVDKAALLGEPLERDVATWVRSLYRSEQM